MSNLQTPAPPPASIEKRFANRSHYVNAVRTEYTCRNLPVQNLPSDTSLGDSYSFRNEDYTELLFIHQPNTDYPTSNDENGLVINFIDLGDMNFERFAKEYDKLAVGKIKKELPGHSFRGEKDKATTIRGVYTLPAPFDGTPDGIITNPPYPP